MAHISYSEMKDWAFCAFYHKLTRIDRVKGFKGNAFTAFGTAVHTICERKLLKKKANEETFVQEFEKCLEKLDDDVQVDQKLVNDMRQQGQLIVPEIEEALSEYFKDFEVVAVELPLYEHINGHDGYKFKGYIDAIVKTPDGKTHVFDWKTTSWGWNAKRRGDAITTYQLTLYKHFLSKKMEIDPKSIETHFALLKRTAKKNRVEFFRVTSGPRKTENALNMLNKALYNIKNKRYIKNRLSCNKCNFRHTEYCP